MRYNTKRAGCLKRPSDILDVSQDLYAKSLRTKPNKSLDVYEKVLLMFTDIWSQASEAARKWAASRVTAL